MATLSFEGESHGELVAKVRRWLASADGERFDEERLVAADVVEQGAELTKEAMRIVAQSAPEPIAQSEIFKALNNLGYKATDTTKGVIIDGLDTIDEATGGSVVKKVASEGRRAVYEMNAAVAKQVLKTLSGQ